MNQISVDFVNQGGKDYLGAEISINEHIICLLAITDDLDLSLEFFHESRNVHVQQFRINYHQFVKVLKECETELKQVIENYREIKF